MIWSQGKGDALIITENIENPDNKLETFDSCNEFLLSGKEGKKERGGWRGLNRGTPQTVSGAPERPIIAYDFRLKYDEKLEVSFA